MLRIASSNRQKDRTATLVAQAIGVALAVLVWTAYAQTESTPAKSCESVENKQFDFWLGDWDALYTEEGQNKKSRNRVSKILNGCVVFEQFVGAPGSPLNGVSHSVYDKSSKQWKQTWVDNTGAYLDFVGGYADGRMVLARETGPAGARFQQRMVWHDITPSAFTWNWERSDDGGKTWRVNWQITYRRRG